MDRTEYHVVLVDLGLPDSCGLETVQAVNARRPHTAIVVLSGMDDEAVAIRSLRQGADDYLVKDQIDANLLERSLRHAFERKRTQQTLVLRNLELARSREALSRETQILESILNSIVDGVVVADQTGRFLRFNPAAERILGIGAMKAPPDQWSERYGLFLPDMETRYPAQELPLVRAMRGETVENDVMFVRRQGHTQGIVISVNAAPLTDDAGVGTGGVAIFRDITEQNRAERKIRQHNAELESRVADRTQELSHAVSELEAFSYSVSHDLRAPLRHIDGFSIALMEDCGHQLGHQAEVYLRRIREGVQRMGSLIDGMLRLSHASRCQLRVQAVDLSLVARRIAADLQRRDVKRYVHFEIEPQAKAVGDPELLGAVMENLMDNAWKFTAKQGLARIHFGKTVQAGETAYFIRDDGVGFDAAYSAKLFQPFQRLHGESEFAGTGIGLATVQRIIRRHGGQVWAEAELENGATFYFTLPTE
jgi:PAS domain S-box-containing protein